jgi:hypothetical protein
MTRQRLANRRACETFAFQCNGMAYRATVSRFPDGRLAEIFLSNHRAGSDADAAARDSAVVCSIALQFGTPVEVIRKALLRERAASPPRRWASRSISSRRRRAGNDQVSRGGPSTMRRAH